MSRIAGVIDLPCDSLIKNDMLGSMHPTIINDHGYYFREDCMLLYRSISGCNCAQPIRLHWGAEQYIMVFDGEIYNINSLYYELVKLGHKISGKSSANVVLHAYAEWKEEALQKIIGVFSFAIWNQRSRTLFVARDKMGVRPLFYAMHRNGLLFASEIKTILKYPAFSSQLDEEGIAQIMLIGPGRVPGSGVFKNVLELQPGCYMVYADHKLHVKRYWGLTDRIHICSFEETAEYVQQLVLDSICRQMDNEAGALLSGGLDSSIINVKCAELLKTEQKKLKTFSVDYEGNDVHFSPGKYQPEQDNEYIDLLRKEIDSDHHTIVLNSESLITCLEDATRARDLPGMADVDFSLLAFSKEIKKYTSVVLSGECADEIFGGYPWFSDSTIRAAEGFPWSQNITYRASLLNRSFKLNADEYVKDLYYSSINQCDILPDNSAEDRSVKQMTWLNHYWFMQTLIDRNDRMCIYNGLRIRAPFCDAEIAEYLYGVPWSYKKYAGREKGLLRYAMQGLVPDKILWRKKCPYPKTYDPAYAKVVKEKLTSLLSDGNAPIWQITDRSAVSRLLYDENQTPWYGQLMKGPQTIAYLLQIDYWLREYNISVV